MNKWTHYIYEGVVRDEAGTVVAKAARINATKIAAVPQLIKALEATLVMLQTTNKAADLKGSGEVLGLIYKSLRDAKHGPGNTSTDVFCPECEAPYDGSWYEECPICAEREATQQNLFEEWAA